MIRRTDAEIKAYIDGYNACFKQFCECSKERKSLSDAIKKMELYWVAVNSVVDMSRYIDADKILYKDLSEGRGVCWVTFRDWIKEMPTADVVERSSYESMEHTVAKLNEALSNSVEVVRCKDCKYAEVADPEDSQDGYICQFHRGCIWFSGSYCSWAERAEE